MNCEPGKHRFEYSAYMDYRSRYDVAQLTCRCGEMTLYMEKGFNGNVRFTTIFNKELQESEQTDIMLLEEIPL